MRITEKEFELMEDKLDYFLESQTKIHVDLLDFTFLNGVILKKLRPGIFWLKEDKLGEILLFSKEVRSADIFKDRGGAK